TLAVMLSVAPNVYDATVSCPGGLTVRAVAGIATFTGCSISKPGLDLHLVASADGLEDAWSFPIDVWAPASPRGPDVELAETGASTLNWGQSVQFAVRMHPT